MGTLPIITFATAIITAIAAAAAWRSARNSSLATKHTAFQHIRDKRYSDQMFKDRKMLHDYFETKKNSNNKVSLQNDFIENRNSLLNIDLARRHISSYFREIFDMRVHGVIKDLEIERYIYYSDVDTLRQIVYPLEEKISEKRIGSFQDEFVYTYFFLFLDYLQARNLRDKMLTQKEKTILKSNLKCYWKYYKQNLYWEMCLLTEQSKK